MVNDLQHTNNDPKSEKNILSGMFAIPPLFIIQKV